MRIFYRTLYCVIINWISLIPIIIFVGINSELKLGPSDDLTIINVKINTRLKYATIIIISCIIKMVEVVLNDIGSPNLGFSVYNPTTLTVYGFTKKQLHVLTNLMWSANNIGTIFKLMIIVSRLDIAMISTLSSEFISIFVIYYLLSKKKKFIPEFDAEEEDDNGMSLLKDYDQK